MAPRIDDFENSFSDFESSYAQKLHENKKLLIVGNKTQTQNFA